MPNSLCRLPWNQFTNRSAVFYHDTYVKFGPFQFTFSDNGWNYFMLVFNLIAGMFVLGISCVITEYLIRRREARIRQ